VSGSAKWRENEMPVKGRRRGVSERVLYLVVCGAGPASRIDEMVKLAQDVGWSVHCIATPAAVEYFLNVPAVEALTGHQVRTTYRKPGDEPLPRADGIIVAPATYNTINKWAAGIADHYVLNQLAELTGLGAAIVVLPFVNQGLASNRVFLRSVAELRQAGVRVLFGPGEFVPHPPRTGSNVLDTFPWALALRSLDDAKQAD
ncbi:MAG TPA: flavoprotein, partial [Cryptosporangiaceae bacterium]|nr:flavoprotein [Cryptosporangiaceae bacterium]